MFKQEAEFVFAYPQEPSDLKMKQMIEILKRLKLSPPVRRRKHGAHFS
jgi:hypothetical protein